MIFTSYEFDLPAALCQIRQAAQGVLLSVQKHRASIELLLLVMFGDFWCVSYVTRS